MTFFEAWGVSILLEYPVQLLVLFNRGQWKRILSAGLAVTTLTVPWFWFVLPQWLSGEVLLIVGQSVVVLVETLVLTSWLQIDWRRCFVAALIANLCSSLLGSHLLGWWNGFVLPVG